MKIPWTLIDDIRENKYWKGFATLVIISFFNSGMGLLCIAIDLGGYSMKIATCLSDSSSPEALNTQVVTNEVGCDISRYYHIWSVYLEFY